MLEHQIKPNNGYFYAHGYGLPPGFPDYQSIDFIRESADAFWGIDKTLPAEVLRRGEPPTLSLQRKSQTRMDTSKLKHGIRKRSSSMRRFLKGSRKISTCCWNSGISCPARISSRISPNTRMMKQNVSSTPSLSLRQDTLIMTLLLYAVLS